MTKTEPAIIPPQFAKCRLLADAYCSGWRHGHGIACHNVPVLGDKIDRAVDYVGLGSEVTAENIREYHEVLCHLAAENARQYSPFEFLAADFNAYDEGGFRIRYDDGDVSDEIYATREEAEEAAKEEGREVMEFIELPSSEELWEAFEAGTADAINADLDGYSDEDYGIEADTSED